MARPSLEETMVEVFKNTIRSILLGQLQSDSQVAITFFASEVNRQRQLEEEVTKQSEIIARDIVSKLKRANYLDRDPPQELLNLIIKETLLEHGVER